MAGWQRITTGYHRNAANSYRGSDATSAAVIGPRHSSAECQVVAASQLQCPVARAQWHVRTQTERCWDEGAARSARTGNGYEHAPETPALDITGASSAWRVQVPTSRPRPEGCLEIQNAISVLRRTDSAPVVKQRALEFLYRQYRASTLRIARGVLLASDLAEDVVQDVFLNLPRYLRRYVDGNFDAWLARVVRRRAAAAVRRDWLVTTIPIELSEMAMVEDATDTEEASDRVRIAICRLPVEARTVVRLRIDDRLSHEEIGARLGISASASATRYSRAVTQLRSLLCTQHLEVWNV